MYYNVLHFSQLLVVLNCFYTFVRTFIYIHSLFNADKVIMNKNAEDIFMCKLTSDQQIHLKSVFLSYIFS